MPTQGPGGNQYRTITALELIQRQRAEAAAQEERNEQARLGERGRPARAAGGDRNGV